MTTTDWILDTALILHPRRPEADSLATYRRDVPTRPARHHRIRCAQVPHADPHWWQRRVLIGVFAALGTVLGVTGGLTMHLCTADGKVFVRAGFTAASLWVLSIAARLVFILWTEHSAGPTLYRFSTQHQITSMQVWVSALILMVLAEMVTRIATILLRAALAKRSALAALAPAAS